PGPGIGGHCIPADPMYLAWKGKSYDFANRFIELASEVNSNMPHHTVHRIMQLLNMHGLALSKSRILLLGVAYKKNVGDTRESPSLVIAKKLMEAGAHVQAFDPFVKQLPPADDDLRLLEHLDEESLKSFEC